MTARPRYTLIQTTADRHLASFAEAVEAGLGHKPKQLPCRFLYDTAGSDIFEEICDLPEYYLTRAEHEILEQRADELAETFGGPITLAELGSGSSTKTRVLIEALLRTHGRLRYVPVDISQTMLETSAGELLRQYEGLEVRAIAGEYREALQHIQAETERPKLIVWLGSSIGNLTREESIAFLQSIRGVMRSSDRLLVGIDLRKGAVELEAAYDDAAGVTARFSLNLLDRMNRELDADFQLDRFRHRAHYLEKEGQVKIDLVSLCDQEVRIEELDLLVEFGAGEAIHIENSFKYGLDEIADLGEAARLKVAGCWLDSATRFSLNLLTPC